MVHGCSTSSGLSIFLNQQASAGGFVERAARGPLEGRQLGVNSSQISDWGGLYDNNSPRIEIFALTKADCTSIDVLRSIANSPSQKMPGVFGTDRFHSRRPPLWQDRLAFSSTARTTQASISIVEPTSGQSSYPSGGG